MKQKFIEWFTKNNNGCSPAMEDDRSFVHEKTQHMFEAYQAGVAEGEARCAALAAEVQALKAAHPQPFGPEMMKALDAYEKHQDETPETGMLDAFFILRDSIRVDTTATDAFLAEVRASAVDEVCLKISNSIPNCYQDELVGLDMAATICGDFASEIRKGVQS